ncbi:MAG: OmpA family protein [Gammaproteobacteria bacterium]|nr:OmpA family protein [Gammaproteobacteria bacterium]
MKLDQDKKRIVLIAGLILVAIASLGGYLYNSQKNTIRALTDESQATQQALSEELSHSRQELSHSSQENDLLNKRIQQLAQDQSALQGSLTEEQAARQQLLMELEAAREERLQVERALKEELQSLATVSSELEMDLRQQLAQKKALDDELDTVSSEKDQVLAELESEQERGRQLQLQIAQVTADVGQKENALSDTEQAVSQLNLQLEQTLKQQNLLKKRIDEINRQHQKDSQQFAELEQRLKRELNESRFEISQLKNRMTVIKLTSEVLFSSGSARIKPTGQKVLSVIAETLNNYPDRAINIEGHTDSVPIGKKSQYTSNWELSTARALAAVDYFQQNKQINPKRLKIVGFGEYQPVAGNDTAADRQLNRRIEIRLLPESIASN